MRLLLLVRHAHAASNDRDVVNSVAPGEGLSRTGVEQALALRSLLADEELDLGVSSTFARARETLSLALGDRPVPRLELPGLDEIDFGAYEGGPLEEYRQWAWTAPPADDAPGGGESRVALALRVAGALETLLARPEDVILAVGHALPLRYALDAAAGVEPHARMTPVPHAVSHTLEPEDIARAIAALRVWAVEPAFADQRG